jgi:hypothetical protein
MGPKKFVPDHYVFKEFDITGKDNYGNWQGTCKHCNHKMKGSGKTRFVNHLLKIRVDWAICDENISKIPADVIEKLKAEKATEEKARAVASQQQAKADAAQTNAARTSQPSISLFCGLPKEDKVMWLNAQKLPAWQWWDQYGFKAPTLKKVAVPVLAQPASSGACERLWSSYDHVVSLRRNSLSHERAEALVFGYSNMQLLRSVEAKRKRGTIDTIAWQCDAGSDEEEEAPPVQQRRRARQQRAEAAQQRAQAAQRLSP